MSAASDTAAILTCCCDEYVSAKDRAVIGEVWGVEMAILL